MVSRDSTAIIFLQPTAFCWGTHSTSVAELVRVTIKRTMEITHSLVRAIHKVH
jgi:hypothetical protein